MISAVVLAVLAAPVESSAEPQRLTQFTVGVSGGTTLAVSKGFGHYSGWGEATWGWDGSIGVDIAYQVSRRLFLETRFFVQRIHAHGEIASGSEPRYYSDRVPFFRWMPLGLRLEWLPFYTSFGIMHGWLLFEEKRTLRRYVTDLYSLHLEVGLSFQAGPGNLTVGAAAQLNPYTWASNDGGSYMQSFLFTVGYQGRWLVPLIGAKSGREHWKGGRWADRQ